MEELENIIDKLNQIERYAGIGGVIFILALAIFLGILYFFLRSYINKWGESKFNKELAKYKKELNQQLGVIIVDKLSIVNQEIENLKASLESNTQKQLSYHTEKITIYRRVYDIINTWFHELTDPHHGGIDQWDEEKIRERVAFLSQLSNQIKIEISKLKMYTDDVEVISQVEEVYLIILNKIYSLPKQYLLKLRVLVSDFAECKSQESIKDKIAEKDVLKNEFHENLLSNIDAMNPVMKDFHNFFRLKYFELVTKNELQLTKPNS